MPDLRILAMLMACLAWPAGAGGTASQLEAEIRTLTLQEAGRDPADVGRDEALIDIGRAHSRAMHRAQTLSHKLNGIGPEERLAREHRSLFGLVSENVAMQRGSPAGDNLARRLVDGWMASPGHRANILAPYDTFEVGCYRDGDTVYCTQLFMRATTRLAEEVAFRQRASAELSVELASHEAGSNGDRRISLAPAAAAASDPGVVVQDGAARLPVPDRPGLYQLKLWTPHQDDPSRYRIIGGPYVCAVRGEAVPRSCRAS